MQGKNYFFAVKRNSRRNHLHLPETLFILYPFYFIDKYTINRFKCDKMNITNAERDGFDASIRTFLREIQGQALPNWGAIMLVRRWILWEFPVEWLISVG